MCAESKSRGWQGEPGRVSVGGWEVSESSWKCKWCSDNWVLSITKVIGVTLQANHFYFSLIHECLFQTRKIQNVWFLFPNVFLSLSTFPSTDFSFFLTGDSAEPRKSGLLDCLQRLTAHCLLCQVWTNWFTSLLGQFVTVLCFVHCTLHCLLQHF